MELLKVAIQSLPWPLVVLFAVILLKTELRGLLTRVNKVTVGKKGFQMETAVAGNSLVTAQVVSVLTGLTASQSARSHSGARNLAHAESSDNVKNPAITGNKDAELPAELMSLAAEYIGNRTPDSSERLRIKNDLAQRMVECAIRSNVSKQVLAQAKNEALFLTLARMVLTFPAVGDIDLLLSLQKVELKHVRYSIALAFGRLVQERLVSPSEAKKIAKMLKGFEINADQSLLQCIENVRAMLKASKSNAEGQKIDSFSNEK